VRESCQSAPLVTPTVGQVNSTISKGSAMTHSMRNLFCIFCIFVIGLIAGCAPKPVEQPIEQTSTPGAIIKADSFPVAQTVNDVTVTLNGFTRDVAYLKANVCFEQPNKENWYSDKGKTFLIVEGQKIPVNTESFLPTNLGGKGILELKTGQFKVD
jgi:hypothetical protein